MLPSGSPDASPFGPESRPGNRVLDLYGDRVTVHRLPSSKEDDVAEYVRNLDAALRSAEEDASCRVIASDASVPEDRSFQATVAALVYARGGQVDWVTSAAGRRTPPEAERFALQIGVSKAVRLRLSNLLTDASLVMLTHQLQYY